MPDRGSRNLLNYKLRLQYVHYFNKVVAFQMEAIAFKKWVPVSDNRDKAWPYLVRAAIYIAEKSSEKTSGYYSLRINHQTYTIKHA